MRRDTIVRGQIINAGNFPESIIMEAIYMPLFMDIHNNVEGVTKEKLMEAHKKDIEVQGKHGVKFVNYWYSEKEEKIFCLCEAPNKAAAEAVHREAHGGEADEVIEVKLGT